MKISRPLTICCVLSFFASLASAGAGGKWAPVRITVLGDSLTAGFGLPKSKAFPAVLARVLQAKGLEVEVIDAGVSGDTTAGGRARLGWTLADRPDLVIVELGANDGLRGLDPARMEENLDAIVEGIRKAGAGVLLTGMRAPPNLGPAYGAAFDPVFARIARRHQVAFYPFFLAGVAGDPALSQADGLHPNPAGVVEIVRRILPTVIDTVEDRCRSGSR